jgi:hypothetical protein
VSYIKIKKLSDGPKKVKAVERVAEFIDNGE